MPKEGTYWFRRFYKECKAMSPHIHFKKIKYGFYRIYWTGGGEAAYLYEVYKDMPHIGYEWYDVDPQLESQKYAEEFEDRVELTRKVKNFVEGYAESIDRLKTRYWMLRNDKEFYKEATKAWKQVRVK